MLNVMWKGKYSKVVGMREERIPHIIHYIWFGGGSKTELIKRCIKSWREKLPGWEIKEWNENNFDVESCTYMKQAYESKKYAFASDYARFAVLYEYGGIYLDTDVEVLKSFPEEMLENSGFAGVESNYKIAPGLVFACEPGNRLVKEILEVYQKEKFVLEDGRQNTMTVVEYVTKVFQKYGFLMNGKEQLIEGIRIYSCEYFCAYDFITREFSITDNTVCIHHYTATWASPKDKIVRKIKDSIKKVVGIEGYKRLIHIKRKLFGVSGE